MCIVQKWRGRMPAEAQYYEKACDGYLYIGSICELPGTEFKRLGPDEEGDIALHLGGGGIAVIGVDPWNYVPWQLRTNPQLESKHGPLWIPGKYDRPRIHHAIVVVSCDSTGFWVLDPWFPDNHQPLLLRIGEFSDCFDGYAVFVDPMVV
jgi:Papain-like cysteine protease AvrRpt2